MQVRILSPGDAPRARGSYDFSSCILPGLFHARSHLPLLSSCAWGHGCFQRDYFVLGLPGTRWAPASTYGPAVHVSLLVTIKLE
jgi:hypothetical protein